MFSAANSDLCDLCDLLFNPNSVHPDYWIHLLDPSCSPFSCTFPHSQAIPLQQLTNFSLVLEFRAKFPSSGPASAVFPSIGPGVAPTAGTRRPTGLLGIS
jgi:hypothetical protein